MSVLARPSALLTAGVGDVRHRLRYGRGMGFLVAMTIPGLAVLLVLLAFAEVAWNRLTGSRILPWTKRRTSRPVAAAGFEEVTAVFQGSKHIEFEQRRTTLMHREDKSDGAPPRDEIDLSSGSARLVARGPRRVIPPGRADW